jgi:hypothetical protein
MRLFTFIKRQTAQSVSEDPIDVFEHGVEPRYRLTSPVCSDVPHDHGVLDRQGAVLVRLPRRLSKVPVEDAHRWLRGEPPQNFESLKRLPPNVDGSPTEVWERAFPGRGLGLPKPLPRRRARRVPLTARDLRERVARLEAAGYRPMEDGYFHQQLTMDEIFEVREDMEYLLMERGRVNTLPDGCYGEIGNIRIYLRPSMTDAFGAATRRLGEMAGNALNDLARRRLLERHGG